MSECKVGHYYSVFKGSQQDKLEEQRQFTNYLLLAGLLSGFTTLLDLAVH